MRKILLITFMLLAFGNVASAEKIIVSSSDTHQTYIPSESVRTMQIGQYDMAKAVVITEKNGKITDKDVWYVDKDTKHYCFGYMETNYPNGTKNAKYGEITPARFHEYDNSKTVDKILELIQQKEGK